MIYRLRIFVHLRKIYAQIDGVKICESTREISTVYFRWIFCGESNFLFGFTFLNFICRDMNLRGTASSGNIGEKNVD